MRDNIKMGLREIDVNTRNWVNSAEDRDYWRAFANHELDYYYYFQMEQNKN